MRLLGLGARAGHLVIGVDGVRRALQQGGVHCLVLAGDASPRAREKTVGLARGKDIPVLAGPSAAELGARLGHPPVMVVGVRDRALAQGIQAAASGAEMSPPRDQYQDISRGGLFGQDSGS